MHSCRGITTLPSWSNGDNELESSQKNIDRLSSLASSSQNNLQPQILALQVALSEKKDTLPPEALAHMLSQKKAMDKLSANNIEYLTKLQRINQLESRFIDEINEKRKNIQFTDLVKDFVIVN